MSETEIEWPPIIEVADKVAWEIAEKWSVVEADDVKQEILTYLLEDRQSTAEYAKDPDFLRRVCWTVGKRYASKERGYYDLIDDQYWYTPEEVRIALRSFVYSDEEIGKVLGNRDDLVRARISDNIVSARADATKGLSKLTKAQEAAVSRVFIYGLPPADEAERRQAYRAVDALTQIMNRNMRSGR